MITVSEAFKTAISKADRPYDEVYGTITFADNTTLTITPSIIPENSVNIVRQCIDGEELEFGGVFLSTLEMSLITDKSRYTFFGARVELDYKINVSTTSTPSYESVHLGKFTISEADRPDKNTIKFIAYDDMRLLDSNIGANVLQGTAFVILQQISSATGYALDFNSAYVTNNFVNTDIVFQFDKDSGITTYREAVKCVCQLIGGFARDNREGKMELGKFHATVDETLTTSHWYSATIADYICNYVALSVTGLKGTFSATSSDPDEVGNLMEIDDAPAWDYGVFATLQKQTNQLFDYLHSISYTPCTLDMPSDPTFDCGDRLELETISEDTVETLITSYEWKWHGGMTVESKGINPYLQGDSTKDIKTNRLITRATEDNKIYFWSFTNPEEVSVDDGDTPTVIGRLRFSSSSDTDAMFVDTIQAVVSNVTDDYCRATITYSLNDIVYDYEIIDDLTEGKHIISLNYPITGLEGGSTNEWKVYLETDGGTVTLPAQSMKATIWGQGLRDLDIWYGLLECEDEYEPLVLGLDLIGLQDEVISISRQAPISIVASDSVEPLTLGLQLVELSENMTITREKEVFNLVTENGDNIATEDGDKLIT